MLKIREYDPKDNQQVEQRIIELQDFERKIEPRRLEGKSIGKKYLKYILKKCGETQGKIFVLDADGKIVGFVSVWAKVKANDMINEQSEVAYISDLLVSSDYRGKGWGKKLLEKAEDYALKQGAKRLSLGVLAENKGARKVYKKFGFREESLELYKSLESSTKQSELKIQK